MKTNRTNERAGFTLIELIVVIAAVPVIIGALLPPLHQAREAAVKAKCQNNLKQIGLAVHNYESANGRLPATVADVLRAAKMPLHGMIGGYRVANYTVNQEEGSWSLTMDPLPGITGSESGTVAQRSRVTSLTVTFTPTVGAAEGRERMLGRVRAAAAEGMAELLGQLPESAGPHVKAFDGLTSSDIAVRAAEPLRNADRTFSFGGIQRAALGDGSVRLLKPTIDRIYAELQLGAFGEQFQDLPAVAVSDEWLRGQDLTQVFGYDTITNVIPLMVVNPTLQQEWTALAIKARNSQRAGNLTSARAYNTLFQGGVRVSAGDIKGITPLGADTLITLAKILYPY
ncbi:MAG: DUF1559 domain-containing protein [Bryobacteraceae bacterium]|nr:DUF1559 domain-containing protein [Bryobacteraceae bacterium]